MRAVITVVGKDAVGILAKVSGRCSEHGVKVTQSILQEMFAMVMLVEIDGCNVPFTAFVDEMAALGRENGLVIHCMHEDIFNAMHAI